MLVLAEYGGKILKTKPQMLLGTQRGDMGNYRHPKDNGANVSQWCHVQV